MPFLIISNHVRVNLTGTNQELVIFLKSAQDQIVLSCCNNIGNIFNLAPASDDSDSDATSTINETVSYYGHSVQVFSNLGGPASNRI